MQVKAQGLLNAAKYIEEEYGRDALGQVVRACSDAVRERYTSAIAINWHPVEEFVEFVHTADRMLGRGNLKLAEEVGAAGARANMKGTVVRIAVYIAKPDFFFRRVAGLWRQFNDEGEMIVHEIGEHAGRVEVRGVTTPNAVFCAVLTGWVRAVATGIGVHDPHVRHRQCRARGDAHCVWEARWATAEAATRVSGGKIVTERRASSLPPAPYASTFPPSSAGMPASSAGVHSSSGTLPPSSGALPRSSGTLPTAPAPSGRVSSAPPTLPSRTPLRLPSKPPPSKGERGRGGSGG